jgi:hypothetical protein
MPKFSVYPIILLLILIPLYPKFPLVGVSGTFVAIRLEDIVVAVTVAVWGIYTVLKHFRIVKAPIPRSILIYWFVGLAAVFSGIFLTKTATPGLGLLHYFRRIEYMLLFLVAYDWLGNRLELRFIIRALLLTAILVALYGLGQQFMGFPVISTTNSEFSKGLALSLGPGARINSTFAGHYDLAAFTVIPLLLLIALMPVTKNRWFLVIAGILNYWVMLLSASRITFAGFFISCSLMLILIRKKSWIIPLVAVSVFGFLVSPQLKGRYLEFITNHLGQVMTGPVYAQTATPSSKAVDTVPDVLLPQAVTEDRSFNIRLQAEWPRALRAFYKNPVLGTGYSSVGLATDNEYLRILAETGVLGFLAFILIFIRFFKTSLPYMLNYRPSPEYAFIIAVSCAIVSLLLGAIFIDYFAASKIAMTAWMVMGLAEKTKQFTKA